MDLKIDKHISGQFSKELEGMLSHVLDMGGIVEQQIAQALEAIGQFDSKLAQKIIKEDEKINAYEVLIDEECARVIAKRQPAAIDLRIILAIAKIIADLERIGDETCRMVRAAQEHFNKTERQFLVDLDHMGQQVLQMFKAVLDALARMDSEAAYDVYKLDKKIDKAYEGITRQLMTYMMEDPRSIPKIMDVMWATRSLERIGDRCQNISEHVIYLIKGKDVRHAPTERIEAILAAKK
ncbi:transcriptional regulator PhoU [Catenovulum agarivorans DS-2]|uniref:Phosphate-specific transport system accessory protein PhoU n=1 Tax=Catenovulum agarivorans DS-2 TaxID=1328313 RepID=W7Q9N0_9ALTE|nr:phosphate signaling complex protein PhoU [Catenovulum agarivorans]EWH09539.1 transcriptional regulator PhoU [Catenovulum agarivorans DS-2]